MAVTGHSFFCINSTKTLNLNIIKKVVYMHTFIRKSTLLLVVLLVMAVKAKSQPSHKVMINEVMQSTVGGQIDLLMEYPDGWVELYNPGNDNVSLEGYWIGKKKKKSKCYELPDISIQPKSYLVIYCDEEDTVVIRNSKIAEIHTDFKLTTDQESDVFLFDSQMNTVDSVHLPSVFLPGVGIGRLVDGADSIGLEMKPTLGKSNEGGHGKAVLPHPTLNQTGNIDKNDGSEYVLFQVQHKLKRNTKMSNGEIVPPVAECHYTIDGTEPTKDSPVLESTDWSYYLVKENTFMRTAYFLDGYVTPPSDPHLFLLHGREIKLPVVALTIDEKDLYDPEIGIFENQPSTDEEARDPSYAHNWHRPAMFNYFDRGGGNPRIHQQVEVRVSGGYTRMNKLKALAVYADDRFGTPDNLNYNFWYKTRNGIRSVPSLVLRASGNDNGGAYIRDAVAQTIFGSYVDIDWQAYQPAIYYINTKYQGIINIRERGNEDNVWTHYDSLTDITLIEISKSYPNGELKKGDYGYYEDFTEFCNQPGQPFEEYEIRMDVTEYTALMICEIFFGNTDFPANNNVLWRPNAEDGKWRWILKDVDRAFGIWNFCPADGEFLKWILREESNITEDVEHNSEQHTLMFRNLINTVPEYREKFIDQFTIYMGDFLTLDNINYWISFASDQIRPEMQYFWQSTQSWENELKNMRTWSEKRIPEMYKQLKERFSLGNTAMAKVNNAVSKQESQFFEISINGVKLNQATLAGQLFVGREYVFEGHHSNSKYEISGWTVTETKGGTTRSWTEMGNTLSYTPAADVTAFAVNAIQGVNGIEEHSSDLLEAVNTIYYNTAGIPSQTPYKGLNIVRYILSNGQSVTEKVYMDE